MKWKNFCCIIFLIQFVFGDEGKRIKYAQPVKGQVEELHQAVAI